MPKYRQEAKQRRWQKRISESHKRRFALKKILAPFYDMESGVEAAA